MKAVLDAPGHDADDTLMPGGIEQAQSATVVEMPPLDRGHRFVVHVGLDRAPFPVEAVEVGGDGARALRVIGDEAFDAERHVGQPACRVEPRRHGETQVARGGAERVAPRDLEHRSDAGLHAPGADAVQALLHEDAVVVVQRDYVRDGAERHEGQQLSEVWLAALEG